MTLEAHRALAHEKAEEGRAYDGMLWLPPIHMIAGPYRARAANHQNSVANSY
jgi:hypothetical protein